MKKKKIKKKNISTLTSQASFNKVVMEELEQNNKHACETIKELHSDLASEKLGIKRH